MNICGKHRKRNTYGEKTQFLEEAASLCMSMGYMCSVMQGKILGIFSRNLVAGNLSRSKTVVIAHYDTPRRPLIPLVVWTGSGFLNYLYVFAAYVLLPLLLAVLTAKFAFGGTSAGVTYFIIYMVIFAGIFPLKASASESDSGIVAMLEVMRELPQKKRAETAFVFTDNRNLFAAGAALLAKNCDTKAKRLSQ